MSGFWSRMFGRSTPKTGTATMAKERLQFILVHDRLHLSPETLKAMKEEILAVISKYVAVSASDVDIALKQIDRHSNMLVAEIPFSKGPDPKIDYSDEDEKPRTGKPTLPAADVDDQAASSPLGEETG